MCSRVLLGPIPGVITLALIELWGLPHSCLSLSSSAHRLGLIGPNGAGKSTLLKTLQGLIAPSAGSFDIGGRPGFLFQNPDHQLLFPTVMEELCFGPQHRGETMVERRAKALAEAHGASELLSMATHTLSEGQKQLVCLLAVLMDAPDVLLLDEPFTSLDHRHTRSLLQTVMSLPQRVIMATHRLDLLKDFDEVIWLDQGSLRLQGPPEHVIEAYLREPG